LDFAFFKSRICFNASLFLNHHFGKSPADNKINECNKLHIRISARDASCAEPGKEIPGKPDIYEEVSHMISISAHSSARYPTSPAITPSSEEINLERQSTEDRSLVLIDCRALTRECLSRSLAGQGSLREVAAYSSLEDWRENTDLHLPPAAILLHIGGNKVTDAEVSAEIREVVSEFKSIPVVILADLDDLTQVFTALDCGVKGYIPASVGVEICVEAIKLALAGGVFVPVSSVLAMQDAFLSAKPKRSAIADLFTPRQADVAEALRRGKANKVIAYELNLRESTVKVHIRNIMRKLKATNRTEVAYKMKDILPFETASA
jgi:DNA-binding NarL/FixJ family response regulator